MTPRAYHLNTVASHQATDRGRLTDVPDLRDESCLRCGGLLVTSYSASLECDLPGTPVTLWRCVNCGNCTDRFILANRLQSPMPARRRARPPAGPPRTSRARGAKTSITR